MQNYHKNGDHQYEFKHLTKLYCLLKPRKLDTAKLNDFKLIKPTQLKHYNVHH